MERRMSLLLLLHLLLYLRTKVVSTPAFSLLLTLFPFFVSFACTVTALSVTAATILQRRISFLFLFFSHGRVGKRDGAVEEGARKK